MFRSNTNWSCFTAIKLTRNSKNWRDDLIKKLNEPEFVRIKIAKIMSRTNKWSISFQIIIFKLKMKWSKAIKIYHNSNFISFPLLYSLIIFVVMKYAVNKSNSNLNLAQAHRKTKVRMNFRGYCGTKDFYACPEHHSMKILQVDCLTISW